MDTDTTVDLVRKEAARRVEMMLANPDAFRRFDANGDGFLDDDEFAVLKDTVEADVAREFDELAGDPATITDTFEEWDVVARLGELEHRRQALEVVDDRFEVIREIGSGSQGTTWLARDRESNAFVALKEVRFAEVDSWKALELFERESRVLASLDHPSIPKFLDAFHVDTPSGPRFFLAQQYVRGDALDILLTYGTGMTDAALWDFARQMLGVLDHIHTREPPIVHRDVKPSNIVRDEAGRFFLVDFGGVQIGGPRDVFEHTLVGTSGYMAPEQVAGRADGRADLYALGATLVHLMTGRSPSRLPSERLRLQWRDHASVAPRFATFVDRLLEPAVEDRPASAAEALVLLDGPTEPHDALVPTAPSPPASSALAPRAHAPRGTRTDIERRGGGLHLKLRPPAESSIVPAASITTTWTLLAFVAEGTGAALAAAALFGVLSLVVLWLLEETLDLRPDGSFTLTRHGTTETGRIRRLHPGADGIVLQTDNASIEIAKRVDAASRVWIADEIGTYLASGPSPETPRDEIPKLTG